MERELQRIAEQLERLSNKLEQLNLNLRFTRADKPSSFAGFLNDMLDSADADEIGSTGTRNSNSHK